MCQVWVYELAMGMRWVCTIRFFFSEANIRYQKGKLQQTLDLNFGKFDANKLTMESKT